MPFPFRASLAYLSLSPCSGLPPCAQLRWKASLPPSLFFICIGSSECAMLPTFKCNLINWGSKNPGGFHTLQEQWNTWTSSQTVSFLLLPVLVFSFLSRFFFPFFPSFFFWPFLHFLVQKASLSRSLGLEKFLVTTHKTVSSFKPQIYSLLWCIFSSNVTHKSPSEKVVCSESGYFRTRTSLIVG